MPDEPTQETQKTQPKKGEPVEIPVPSKDQVMSDFEKVSAGGYAGLSDEELCSRIREATPPPATTPLKPTVDIEAQDVGELLEMLREAKRRDLNCD